MSEVKISCVLWEALRQRYLGEEGMSAEGGLLLDAIITEEVEYKDRRMKTREKYLRGKFGEVKDKDKYFPPMPVLDIYRVAVADRNERPRWLTDEMRKKYHEKYGIDLPLEKSWVNVGEDIS